ncbi:histidinol dehydrogenase [Aminipila luticellarii]|uniref:Histidinol dehydrogenase n=1 Tax=Aminipila luticellarii TaxID=2507160 RepID=A0A410PWA6_9FIRM|nr:histidinol dehydrogenase [Aminipila luticellarii]QAT43233.1 histidinol dehydrogenase [Aminipila luticellarii]
MIRILSYNEMNRADIFQRSTVPTGVEDTVSRIIQQVKEQKDSALLDYCTQFDGGAPERLEVSEEEIRQAFESTDPQFIKVLKKASDNITSFHSCQIRNSFIQNKSSGIVVGQKIVPLDRVGLYVPGGTAAYPSSVLMNCIPAKIAGVKEIIMVTPGKNGTVPPAILSAAKIAGVHRIFKVGGAQAVAALAYGTETIPKVDKIVGPGNAFVAEAKKQVFGSVDIDMIAGPSEILIIADQSCQAGQVAADMLSQAEHDKMASAVLVTDSPRLAESVRSELERQLSVLPREEIARSSIENNGKIIVAPNLETAIDIANEIAPEHLELCVDNPFDYLDRIRHAGSVFLGKNCPEALGDYMAGPNHTLPTSGTARFSSPLSVDDFVKKYQYTYYTKAALSAAADDIIYFAEQEGLSAHARSVSVRLAEDLEDGKDGMG